MCEFVDEVREGGVRGCEVVVAGLGVGDAEEPLCASVGLCVRRRTGRNWFEECRISELTRH